MPLTRLLTDVFGLLTIALVVLLIILGLFCIYRSLYFQIRILRRDFLHLIYFNGPWLARIFLILVTIWWGLWEILRLTLLREKLKLLSTVAWQKSICKYYILSNLGFAEPVMFLTLIFLLHASLRKSKKWNRMVILYAILFSYPVFILQLVLIYLGPKFNKKSYGTKMAKHIIDTSSMVNESNICIYPLFGTSFIAFLYLLLILYTIYIGRKVLSLVINKVLRKRVHWLMSSIFVALPLRTSLLALSAFLHPGSLEFEAIVFLAFCTLFFSAAVGVFVLVYYPVADSIALRYLSCIEMLEMPYDDYFHENASLVANQSNVDAERSSDASTLRGSISFTTMMRNEPSALESLEETCYLVPSSPSLLSSRPMLSLVQVLSL